MVSFIGRWHNTLSVVGLFGLSWLIPAFPVVLLLWGLSLTLLAAVAAGAIFAGMFAFGFTYGERMEQRRPTHPRLYVVR